MNPYVTYERLELPPIIVQAPLCPLCNKETYLEDNHWTCETCVACWDASDERNTGSADEDVPQCRAQVQPFKGSNLNREKDFVYRCVRSEGHPMMLFDAHVGIRVFPNVTPDCLFEWDASHENQSEGPESKQIVHQPLPPFKSGRVPGSAPTKSPAIVDGVVSGDVL